MLPIVVMFWGKSWPLLGSHYSVVNNVIHLLMRFKLRDHTKGDILHDLICRKRKPLNRKFY